ncbi:E3 ubiquitin-protein ligase Zswim2-like isoform X2 [Cimex lectularius]|uniref:SWIM-type domain-containing protein n=1 Tax=Cimex lectularius TaxID=79782 RepID=A0A8I6S459_CIMLE|nr:E3 ubiquitin-protein ligase Zswim2-like isoform X2 [Cimex lectularius]XP_014258412.1 E3 ubiquitin-protein ligase Zswim2-like isoform X2 [Cimex lectularius]
MHRACSRVAQDSLERAEKADLYLVREAGPAAWTIAERGGTPFRVCLGQSHSCTCPCFRMTKDLCVHIVWVLTKKLAIRPSNPICYQLGMTERELEECLYPKKLTNPKRMPVRNPSNKPVRKRIVDKDDPCPICLEPFVAKRSPIVYCTYGCGQGMHGHCMEVVARHQDDPRNLTCPMCRGHFSSLPELRLSMRRTRPPKLAALPKHETYCTYCENQVFGSLYKCLRCPQIRACAQCVNSVRYSMHAKHGLAAKTSPDDKWKVVAVQCRSPSPRRKMMPKSLPKIQRKKRHEGPGIFMEPVAPQPPKCPICTDHGTNYFELECGHLVTTPASTPVPVDASAERRNPKGTCARLAGCKQHPTLIPPQVVAHRLELYKRAPQISAAPRAQPKPRKKKEPPEPPLEPDIRENGRILGSKVLPIMALLLQRKADETDQEQQEADQEQEAEQEKKPGKRRLTVQCVQLLPDAESAPQRRNEKRPWKRESTLKKR